MKDSVKLFGCNYGEDTMAKLRDLFLNAKVAYVYRLGESVKAENAWGKAKCGGVLGNEIKTKISVNIDDAEYFDVITYFKNTKRDAQKVKSAAELMDNDYVVWNKDVTLEATGYVSMTGGADSTITGEDYQKFLNAVESLQFNTLAAETSEESVNSLIAAFTKRMREEQGVKFQSVLYRYEADDIGVINVDTKGFGGGESNEALIWFVAGGAAGCDINESMTNMRYKGSMNVSQSYTQSELEEGMQKGKFIIHRVEDETRVLADINSFVSVSSEMGEVFRDNQTVRIIDQIAIDDAKLFKSKYLGAVPNDEAGRVSLWNDIVEHRKSLEKMRAIENFKSEDVSVEKGDSKTSVVITSAICPVNSMTHLYITMTLE